MKDQNTEDTSDLTGIRLIATYNANPEIELTMGQRFFLLMVDVFLLLVALFAYKNFLADFGILPSDKYTFLTLAKLMISGQSIGALPPGSGKTLFSIVPIVFLVVPTVALLGYHFLRILAKRPRP
ncbi:hypothetical protein [Serratia nevei]|uniref:hypothetical protein n=1 Tax=Serratia nevei TaxID=2703794 RepID=UPI00254B1FD1|nr:hypothetical protein [Serratia nevei]MDK5165531.1 hypothetical protein [Serratia nevei]